jgi:thioredoxin
MNVTTADFGEVVLERSRVVPVVVDFWAAWCGPCHALAPVLENAVAASGGAVELAKVDIDAEPSLASRFDVRSIPAVKAFRNGTVVAEFVGARPPIFVEDFVDELTQPSEAERLFAELEERGELPEVVAAYGSGDAERALALLLEEIQSAADGRRDELKRLMVALFTELGPDDPVAATYRRRLATTLY